MPNEYYMRELEAGAVPIRASDCVRRSAGCLAARVTRSTGSSTFVAGYELRNPTPPPLPPSSKR